MIPWIQVYSNLPQHPKTSRLADELGLTSAALNPNVLAVGLLVSLWTWAIQNAYDGDLSRCSARAIAEACRWKKKPEALVKALINSGFLDADMRLHDWEEYASLLVEQEENRRAKTRERVQKYRDKKRDVTKGESNTQCNAVCNVTEDECNAPTIPNHTIPNHTMPNPIYERERAHAHAREAYGSYQNVLLSHEELEALQAEFPDWEAKLDNLSGYLAQTGKKYASHYATLKKWAAEDAAKKGGSAAKPKPSPTRQDAAAMERFLAKLGKEAQHA